ncbi:hypothetical protein [uncultured Sulfitobacter sp.]|uniref:hypothetical protein n=1 Tax=uncultured Sulfitobacter sp. TaxID=191468 RepID=UPI002638892D|nr:hypothetical protein [uncultured Sulfitobacter sp.]
MPSVTQTSTRASQGCLEKLHAHLHDHPEVAAASPRAIDGRHRPSFRRRSRLLHKSAHWSGTAPNADADVPLLNGPVIFVSRAHFEGIGGFDEAIFLYHEDDDLSMRLKA